MLACSLVDNNTVRLASGTFVNQGYIVCVPGGSYEDLTVESGTQNMYRKDLLVAEFARGGGSTWPRARPNNARVIRYTFDESFFKTRRLACRFACLARYAFFLPKNSSRIHLLTCTQNGIQHREPGHTEGRRAGAPAAAAHGGAALPARHAAARLRLHVRPRRRAQHQQPVGVHVRPPAAHHCPGFALHRTSTQSPRSVTLWKCRAQWRRCSTTRTR